MIFPLLASILYLPLFLYGVRSQQSDSSGGGGLHIRSFFYVGGQYVVDTTTNTHNLINQAYVEKLVPQQATKPLPLVFFHGAGVSGTTWLNTPDPDNPRGWASHFLDQGYIIYLLDASFVGRAPPQPSLKILRASAEVVEIAFTAPERFKQYPQAKNHNQWPGNGSMGDPVFDAFYASFVNLPSPFSGSASTLNILDNPSVLQQAAMRKAGCALLGLIGQAILISHSLGAIFPWLVTDACPSLVRAHVTLEPDTSPFTSYNTPGQNYSTRPWGLTDIPITYDPPISSPDQLRLQNVTSNSSAVDSAAQRFCVRQNDTNARKLTNIAKAPVLVVTAQASIHVTYDQCIVNFLRQAGVTVNWMKLEEIGIFGNGHFFFLEKNNHDIWKEVEGWINKMSIGRPQ